MATSQSSKNSGLAIFTRTPSPPGSCIRRVASFTNHRVERLLTQLLYSGVLAQQKAVIFGQFNGYTLAAHDKGFKLQSVVDWLRRQISAPVLTHLPYGHVETKVCLPVGAPVQLSVAGRDAMLYWGHQ